MNRLMTISLIGVMGLASCSKTIDGQLVQIGSIKRLGDGWEFLLIPSDQGLKVLRNGTRYSIDVGNPMNTTNYDAAGCSILPDIDSFPIGEGVSVSFHSSGSRKRILFDGRLVLECDRQGQDECLQVYSTVRLEGDDSGFFWGRVDPELIDPLIVELCDADSPKVVEVRS